MTDHRLAFALVVVVTMAVFSGGASQSLFQDSEVVTATVDVDTGSQETVLQNGSQQERTCEVAERDAGDEEVQGDAITIRFEPANRTVVAGNETEYRVLVEGAADNITSYHLGFTLCDPTVATFEGFDHRHVTDASTHSESVTDDLLEVSAGYATDYPTTSTGDIILGTITVAGNASGQIELGVADVQNDIRDDEAVLYNITATEDASLAVTARDSDHDENDDSSDGTDS